MAEKIKETLVKKEEGDELVTVIIDPKLTNGGLRTFTENGVKRYVGKVTVPAHVADSLLQRQTEYAATISKLNDPTVRLRNQNIDTTRKAYMADIEQYGSHPKFSKLYGMSDAFQMSFVSDLDKKEWAEERMGLFNY